MLVLPIERPATGFVFSFKNCPAVTDLLMCRKYWRQRKKTLDLYYYRHSLFFFFFFFWRRSNVLLKFEKGGKHQTLASCPILVSGDAIRVWSLCTD